MQVEFKILDENKIIEVLRNENKKAQVLEEIETAIKNCEGFINAANKVKGSYFWTPARNSAGRRYQEEKYSYEAAQTATIFEYTLKVNVRVSARNFYVYKTVEINGQEGTVKTVKTFLKDLESLKLYLTQEDVLIKLSKEATAQEAAQKALKETEELIFTELLNTFNYATLKAYKSFVIQAIIEETIETLMKLNKRQITANKAIEIQNSFEFVEAVAYEAQKFIEAKERLLKEIA